VLGRGLGRRVLGMGPLVLVPVPVPSLGPRWVGMEFERARAELVRSGMDEYFEGLDWRVFIFLLGVNRSC
jgi:hypothetical protein